MSLKSYYDGKVVFITGATGFIGKVLMEKLLRTADVKEIAILIRPSKKGALPKERIQQICDQVLFDTLKEADPNFRERIRLVEGDLMQPHFGIKEEDLKYIQENVHNIFHAAASIKFNEEMRKALEINVKATQEILEISKKCEKLESFVYVSTAYSNSYQKVIKEEIYTLDYSPLDVLAHLDDEKYLAEVQKYAQKWPNNYTFTKSLAESLVSEYMEHVPVAIIRPSIVIPSIEDPIAGWCDNLMGGNGFYIGWYYGFFRTTYVDAELKQDFVPVDYVSNTILGLGWKTATQRAVKMNDIVYNCVSTPQNPAYFGELFEISRKVLKRYPLEGSLFPPYGYFSKHYFVYRILRFILHIIPAYIMDGLLVMRGDKPKLVSAYDKAHDLIDIVSFFGVNEFLFDNDNTRKLYLKMSAQDHHEFPCDFKNYTWDYYYTRSVPGLKKNYFKEDLNNIPAAIVKQRKKKVMLGTLLIVVLLFIFYGANKLVKIWFR